MTQFLDNRGNLRNDAYATVASQLQSIENEVVREEYDDILYDQLIPVDSSAPDWAQQVGFTSAGMVGKAKLINGAAQDVPLADVTTGIQYQQIYTGAIGYGYSYSELNTALYTGFPLTSEKASAARRASEELANMVALYGQDAEGNNLSQFTGLINNTTMTIVTAPNGATGASAHTAKTHEEIIADINTVLSNDDEGIIVSRYQKNTLLVAPGLMQLWATKTIGVNADRLLQYIKESNLYTLRTGNPLTILEVPGLDTAGAGNTGRMIGYARNPNVLKFHMPKPHEFLPLYQSGPLQWMVPGVMRLGGTEIRRPGDVKAIDGV